MSREVSMLGSYDLVLFDFDDTLVDFAVAEAFALDAVGARFGRGVGPEALATFRTINRELWQEHDHGTLSKDEVFRRRFERFLPLLAVPHDDETASHANAAFLEALAESAEPFAGAIELVRRVAERAPIGIVTNGHGATQRRRFVRAGLATVPHFAVISEEVGASKPARAIFEFAYRLGGLAPGRRTLMIGDNLRADVAGALAMGFDACWINPSGKPPSEDIKPTCVVARVADLTFP